ncbi:MAG: hypothetical protein ACE5LX_07095 [Nitrospinota bacterium]
MRKSLRLGVVIVMLSTVGLFLAVALWRMALLGWAGPFRGTILKEAALEIGQVLLVGGLILYFLGRWGRKSEKERPIEKN